MSFVDDASRNNALILHLEQRAFSAATAAALGFVVVNETLALSTYRQSFLLRRQTGDKPFIAAASGLVEIDQASPFAIWLLRLIQDLPGTAEVQQISVHEAPQALQACWREWLPEHLLLIPLSDGSGPLLGHALYARETPWLAAELQALERVHSTYAYCLAALVRERSPWLQLGRQLIQRRHWRWVALAVLALMFAPVPLSALAPAEVVAIDALMVAAPQEGVISAIHVRPNQLVKAGDALFSLDATALANRREVALKGLSIARAESLVAEQRAFDEQKSKSELAAATGRVREKEAELAAAEALLARMTVHAEREGVVIFGDGNDWIGRPIQTGERIMQLADPTRAGLLVWLPVADALNLEAGAPLRLFLHTQPLSPLAGAVVQTSYQALLSPDGIASYRLLGHFAPEQERPRIGLRGTARVSAGWTVLGYYLFRRPLAAVREWTGL